MIKNNFLYPFSIITLNFAIYLARRSIYVKNYQITAISVSTSKQVHNYYNVCLNSYNEKSQWSIYEPKQMCQTIHASFQFNISQQHRRNKHQLRNVDIYMTRELLMNNEHDLSLLYNMQCLFIVVTVYRSWCMFRSKGKENNLIIFSIRVKINIIGLVHT